MVHHDVEACSEELLHQSYAINNQHTKLPTKGGILLAPRCFFLWHKGAYNSTFPCLKANYPYAIKKQGALDATRWFFIA